MNEQDKEKIENIISDRKHAHSFFSKESEVYRRFVQMEEKTFSDGNLKKKYKELIALGISIVINCESCMQWHVGEAIKSGASFEELIESIEVGIEMGGGPATVSSRFALKVMEYYKKKGLLK
ncbi:MAG: carboxymuconolactone decarboxylase family protein [Promethearchaeota archaeon]|nr:MAG: carboxymuconolactone decarboxylase family protein [Candidatus Lokiarchaeota archaeon]